MTSGRESAEGRASGLPLRALAIVAGLWLIPPGYASAEEGHSSGKYRFEQVDDDFGADMAWSLRHVSHTLVQDPRSASALIYVHSASMTSAGAAAPAFEELRARAEYGGYLDFPLALSLLNSGAASVRARVAEVLADVEDANAVTLLAGLLRDPEAKVAHAAADALVEQNTDAAAHALGTLLIDRGAQQRHEAAEALTEFESDTALAYLHQIRADPDARIRRFAVEALNPDE